MKNLIRPVLVLLFVASGLVTRLQAQVPVLNSYPSASGVIFLDFDGHSVVGTGWNILGPVNCGASGLPDDKIIEIFNRVAEDYRPFNLNVTTDSTKFLAAPVNKRMRVILTVTSSWYGSGAGGVAFVGSFADIDPSPCFVFTALLSYNTKNIAEAVAHEAGHTLGLYHQAKFDANCVKVSDYHSGTGSGEIGWAPIMGVGYYRNFTLWNSGPNSYGCNSIQSDLDVITTVNGFSYRTDDHTNAFATATKATFTSNKFVVSGIIERNTDQDLFKFTLDEPGRFQLDAVPYNVGTGNSGSDLDLQVTLFHSTQTPLNIYNPGTLLSSVVDTILNTGTYYIRVEGKGNEFAPAYASLGSYSLQGNFSIGGTLPIQKLELKGITEGDNHKLSWDIVSDEQIADVVVEIASDGRNFNRLIQTGNSDRGYQYRPLSNGPLQYRLNVTLADGRQYYSNIITLRTRDTNHRPQLVNNLVVDNIIKVTSPGKFNYKVYDLNGRTITQGTLVTGINDISASGMINGMYMIRFANNDQQWTDRFVRQ